MNNRQFLVIPAIDLLGGKCVRLEQGDYDRQTVYAEAPAAVAGRWQAEGARLMHLVDLDGARQGRPCNQSAIRAVVEAVEVPVELGGGIRRMADIEAALSWGVERVILGTAALSDPDFLHQASAQFGARVLAGIDARGGYVATRGWRQDSPVAAMDLARSISHLPIGGIIYTDIRRDGMLTGPNLPAVVEFCRVTTLPVIASGGVSTIEDILSLAAAEAENLTGVIVGKALYEQRFTLREAIAALGNRISHEHPDRPAL